MEIQMATKSQTAKKTPQVPGAPTPDTSAAAGSAPAADGAAEKTTKVKAATKAPGELPDESDIDPTKISRAVLTKQGWVCPA
jgi:hypothetical protein